MRFNLHQVVLEAGGLYFLPLPKLNLSQRGAIAARLKDLGYRLNIGRVLRASSSSGFLRVDSSGLATSNLDMLDPLAPIIPHLLEAKKESVPSDVLAGMYFDVRGARRKHIVRLKVRAESSTLWRELRAANESLLTPDEATAVRFLLSRAEGRVEVVTDYPTEESKVRQIGRRVYFSSMIDVAEFASNLRTVEGQKPRNAYLPTSAVLGLQHFHAPTEDELVRVLDDLGEWCYFSPT